MGSDPASAGIQVKEVRVLLDGCVILEDISLEVAPGEVVALQGTSGSGKTTLLHAIAGFIPLDEGQILVGGTKLSESSEAEKAAIRRQELGLMTQDFHLLSKLSAERNAALAPLLAGKSAKEALDAAHSLLEALGLAEHHKAPASRLSRGQRQRVALARALAFPRPLLLLDEPTSSLDPESRETVMGLIRQQAESGTAILIASHDAALMTGVDRVLSMKDGRIVEAT